MTHDKGKILFLYSVDKQISCYNLSGIEVGKTKRKKTVYII